MDFLKEALLILIPLLIGIGQILKVKMSVPSKYVPVILLCISILLAFVYGLISSTESGWRYWVDSIVITGLCHGCVAAFCAMGIFDLGKQTLRKEAAA